MSGLLTEITEITTGLGMTGIADLEGALAARPQTLRNVTDAHWDRLDAALTDPAHAGAFAKAWTNGRVFLEASDGLRGRVPLVIEWKGTHQPPGFDLIPADLRIDHVYLVSCKYQSRILSNSSPSNLFVRRLADRSSGPDGEHWYELCAPEAFERFYSAVRMHVGPEVLPRSSRELERHHIQLIRDVCSGRWPAELAPLWAEFSFAVATVSAELWLARLPSPGRREEMLWRLLRFSPAPYFVLGSSDAGPLRIRIGTPWDWRQSFRLAELLVTPAVAGQPRVNWTARVIQRQDGSQREVAGHVEVRWAHGRFSSVEAKVYLDTPHAEVPGYFPLGQPA